MSFGFAMLRRGVRPVRQAEAAECGLACLAMIAGYHGLEYDLPALRGRLNASMRGLTLSQLLHMSSALELSGRVLRLEPEGLSKLRTPCVLHWNMDHFVVLEKVRRGRVTIVDPALGHRTLGLAEVSDHFTGIAAEFSPTESFKPGSDKGAELTLGSFFRGVRGLPSRLLQVFLISLAIQGVSLLIPFYSQIVIDDVIASRDTGLLNVLALGFGLLGLVMVVIGAARSLVVAGLGAELQFGWAVRLFHHMIRLPLGYFEKRSVADVLSRFRSLGSVQGLATNTIVEAVVDGIMALTTLAVMLCYSGALTFVPIAAIAVYAGIRLAVYRFQRENANTALLSAAREDGHFLESLRGILAIKTFSREQVRETNWQNRMAESIRDRLRLSLFTTSEQLLNQALMGLEAVFFIWLAARLVMSNELSIGMLLAFLAYKAQFTARATALVDKFLEFKLVSVHLGRISDIALAEKDPASAATHGAPASHVQGNLTVRDVAFRYSSTDPWVIDNANLDIAAGECIAIHAPSGAGKTTLIKIMMGLLRPERGQVFVDGLDLAAQSGHGCRRHIAAVMQEDTLLSGSLYDNIAFFDAAPDLQRIETVARIACIDEDIRRMPMGYFTMVGDMGAALSGGQKQRVLLARALYASPRILFLDEATAHLDAETERRIYAALADLRITRIVVTHRPETMALANRILRWHEVNPAQQPSVARNPALRAVN